MKILFLLTALAICLLLTGCATTAQTSLLGTSAVSTDQYNVVIRASGINYEPNPSWLGTLFDGIGLAGASYAAPGVGYVIAAGQIGTNLAQIGRPNETGLIETYIKGVPKQVIYESGSAGYGEQDKRGTTIKNVWVTFYRPNEIKIPEEPPEETPPAAPTPTP